jgi:hypothetical protein
MTTPTHITTSGGLISAAFIENIRKPGSYPHLYGLTQEELAYILDTFPIVRRKDEEQWREYRTKRLVLEEYEGLESLRH